MNQDNKAFVYSKDPTATDRLVVDALLYGQPWGQWMLEDEHDFCVGWGRKSVAPVAPEYVSSSDFALLHLKDGACRLALSQLMLAAIGKDGIYQDVSQPAELALERGTTARVTCGAVTFNVAWMPPPGLIGKPTRRAWSAHWPLMVSCLALLGVLFVLWLVPSDPMALSVWDPQRMIHLMPARSIPPVLPTAESLAALKTQGVGSSSSSKAKPSASSAKPKAQGRLTLNPPVAAALSVQEFAPDKVGLLGVLAQLGNAPGPVTSVFAVAGSESLGGALSGLAAVSMGDAFSTGGLRDSLDDSPAGATVGDGVLKTNGKNYGRDVGGLGPKKKIVIPAVSMVPCAPGAVGCGAHGVLDREIVRREIRKHIKEIEYCYEQQLVRIPTLAGRVAVRFVIAPTGTVAAASIAEASLGNGRVEACITDAVRRWQFPVAQQAGITIVTYPFVFSPAGG